MTLKLDRRTVLLAGVSAAAAICAGPAFAQTLHEVQMLNKDPDDKKRRMVFKPLIQVVQPGDTVKFVSTDKSHNSASLEDMMPEGAEGWNSKVNKDIEVTFDKPGFYGYKCTPHYAVGMVGLIIVEGEGKMDNYEAAKAAKHKGQAKKVFKAIFEQVEAEGLAS